MIPRSCNLLIFMACFSFAVLNMGTINLAYAQQNTGSSKIQGKVSDIINVTNYTYAEVDTGTARVWAAGPTTALKKGDIVTFLARMPMKDFYSESLDRKFSLIYFISRFTDTDKVSFSPTPPAHGQIKPVRKSLNEIEKAEGGKNISEIYAEKDKLNGEVILVRGKVTRFSAEIMGKNWLHIQDSSSFDDLTVTTDNTVAVGDVVTIKGELELDKDFDYGYVYPVIVQNAKVTKE